MRDHLGRRRSGRRTPARAGRAGPAGRTGSWRRRAGSRGTPASRRSSEPTASTIVCCGASLSMTAMSPNCRSASTSTTGWSLRWARSTARLVASTDLPAPPLVENTVMTWPSARRPRASAAGSRRRGRRRRRRRRLGRPARTASLSCAGVDRRAAARPGRRRAGPAGAARWRARRRRGWRRPRGAAASSCSAPVEPDRRRRTTGRARPPAGRRSSAVRERRRCVREGRRRRSPSCMASRLRTAWSASTTATGAWSVRRGDGRPGRRRWGVALVAGSAREGTRSRWSDLAAELRGRR